MKTLTPHNAPELLEHFGPSPETFAFVALAALPLVMTLGLWQHGHQQSRDLVIGAGVLLFALYAILAFRISLSSEGVRYRSPFGRPPLVRWSSISQVRTGAKPLGHRTYPPYFMEIHTNEREQPVTINIKFFRRKALMRLASLISERAPHAQLDEATKHLAKGAVPSVFFKSRSKGAV